MICCPSCETEDPPSVETCIHCGADLLPGSGIGKRAESIGAGIAGGLVSGALLYAFGQMEEPPFCCPSPQALLIGVVVLPVAGLVNALRRTPLHERYALRARRHLDSDPQPSATDHTNRYPTARLSGTRVQCPIIDRLPRVGRLPTRIPAGSSHER